MISEPVHILHSQSTYFFEQLSEHTRGDLSTLGKRWKGLNQPPKLRTHNQSITQFVSPPRGIPSRQGVSGIVLGACHTTDTSPFVKDISAQIMPTVPMGPIPSCLFCKPVFLMSLRPMPGKIVPRPFGQCAINFGLRSASQKLRSPEPFVSILSAALCPN